MAELQHTADRVGALARLTAPLERFHAELTTEAAEEELRQGSSHVEIADRVEDGWNRRQ